MRFKRIGLILAVSCVSIITWELVALRHASHMKPSVGVTMVANQAHRVFSHLGRGFAWMSSYLTIVDLQDLYRAVDDLTRPTLNLLTSPLAFVEGYWEIAKQYKYPLVIALGSSILLIVGVYVVPRFCLAWRRRRSSDVPMVSNPAVNSTADSSDHSSDEGRHCHSRRSSSSD